MNERRVDLLAQTQAGRETLAAEFANSYHDELGRFASPADGGRHKDVIKAEEQAHAVAADVKDTLTGRGLAPSLSNSAKSLATTDEAHALLTTKLGDYQKRLAYMKEPRGQFHDPKRISKLENEIKRTSEDLSALGDHRQQVVRNANSVIDLATTQQRVRDKVDDRVRVIDTKELQNAHDVLNAHAERLYKSGEHVESPVYARAAADNARRASIVLNHHLADVDEYEASRKSKDEFPAETPLDVQNARKLFTSIVADTTGLPNGTKTLQDAHDAIQTWNARVLAHPLMSEVGKKMAAAENVRVGTIMAKHLASEASKKAKSADTPAETAAHAAAENLRHVTSGTDPKLTPTLQEASKHHSTLLGKLDRLWPASERQDEVGYKQAQWKPEFQRTEKDMATLKGHIDRLQAAAKSTDTPEMTAHARAAQVANSKIEPPMDANEARRHRSALDGKLDRMRQSFRASGRVYMDSATKHDFDRTKADADILHAHVKSLDLQKEAAGFSAGDDYISPERRAYLLQQTKIGESALKREEQK